MCKIKQMYTVVQKKKYDDKKKRVYLNKTSSSLTEARAAGSNRGKQVYKGGCTVPSAWSGLADISTAGGAEVM